MEQIKVINNFISKDNATRIVNYIDRNKESFREGSEGLWFKKRFGVDVLYRAGGCESIIDGLEDIRELSIDIVENVKTMISKQYGDNDDIFLNSFWYVKHLPGATVSQHNDIDNGNELDNGDDTQFVYSSVLYLNDTEDGDLEFPNLNLSIKTKLGDLVIFPSNGDDMVHGVSSISQDRYSLPMWFTKDKNLELKFSGNKETSS
jgi:hypothetical protein